MRPFPVSRKWEELAGLAATCQEAENNQNKRGGDMESQTTQWYLLPAIRAQLVKELRKLGVKQVEIARMMSITPAAVSQYINGTRGKTAHFDVGVKKLIASSAKRMVESGISEEDFLREICELGIVIKNLRLTEQYDLQTAASSP